MEPESSLPHHKIPPPQPVVPYTHTTGSKITLSNTD